MIYSVFQKKFNPPLFEFLQEMIRFEVTLYLPSESSIYLLCNDIQVESIN